MENKQKPMDLRLTLKSILVGFLIGIGFIAPGVSGGAIAVVFGLYDRITDAIGNFYKDFWNKVKFLLPLAIGAGISVLLLGKLIQLSFEKYQLQTCLLFIGLMVGTIPSVIHTANKKGFRWWYVLVMLAAMAMTMTMGWLNTLNYNQAEVNLNFGLLLLCGVAFGFGTIVPGVSTSFLLMSAGVYMPLLKAFNDRDILTLIPVGIGFVLFVLIFAKFINWLYRVAYGVISYIVTGLLIGSVFLVIPPVQFNLETGLSLLLAIIGGLFSWYLLRLKREE